MLETLLAGKLVGAPEQRTSKGGKPYVTAKLRCSAGPEEVLFIRLTSFSESCCATLMALGDGDGVAVAGSLKPTAWVDREGNARPGADVVASQVLTAYAVKRKREAVQPKGDAVDHAPKVARPRQRELEADDFGHAGDDGWLAGGAL